MLHKERIICDHVEFTPIMNHRRDKECMTKFLEKDIVNGVQDRDLTPFGEFLPRSAPLVDFLSIGLHSGAGWKYPSANTIHGIQADQGLSYQMLEDVEVNERAWIMWNNNLVIQKLSDEMEFSVMYRIPDESLSQELWISRVPGTVGLLQPQTLPGRYLKLDSRFNSPGTVAKRCKTIGRLQRDCILEWARLNPESISQFLDRLASKPKWQIAFCGLYDNLRLLHLRLYNRDARTVKLMELQLEHRVEFLLEE